MMTGAALVAFAALVVALPLAVYWKSMSDFFMLDDFIWLKAASSHGALDLLRRETSFSTPLDPFDYPTPYIRPLTDAYFWVTWRVFGFDPTAYHVLNLVMHLAIGVVVAVLGWQLSRSRLAAAGGALIFLTLPTYSFAVSWVSEVTDLLSALLYLLSLCLFLAYLRRTARDRRGIYAASLAAFALALLAKEPAVTLAGVAGLMALAEARDLRRPTLRRVALDVLPFVLLAAAFYFGVYRREYNTISADGAYRIDLRLFDNLWTYIKWMAFPFGATEDFAALRVAAALAFFAAGAAALLSRHPPLSFLFLWTLICLAPLSLFEHGIDHRYTYLASVPFALFVASGLQTTLSAVLKAPRRTAIAFGACLLVLVPALALEARSRQDYAHLQAVYYRHIFEDVPRLCGPLPPGSRIALVGSPALDLVGIDTQVALNFSYDRVAVKRYETRAGIPAQASGEQVCVASYERGGFVRLE